jgi:N-acyl-D-aspartate/D-glutamate deacylase
MCGATYTTSMLAEFPARGLMTLEEVVRQLTDTPARLFGLKGCGRIEPGYRADIVMFDPAQIQPCPLGARRDLPGDSARIFAGSNGMNGVWVNGVRIVTDGVLNDNRPGRVMRPGIDTETVTNATGLALTSS